MSSPLKPQKHLKFNNKNLVTIDNGYMVFFKDYTDPEGLKKEIWLTEKKEAIYYYTQWVELDENRSNHIARKISSKKSLEENVKSRDTDLTKQLTRLKIGSKIEIESFLEHLGVFIQREHLMIYPATKEDEDSKNPQKEYQPPESFQDYDPEIKNAAIQIISNNNPLQVLKNGVGAVHIGDDPEIEFSILKEFTSHVLNAKPVHTRIAGGTDSGKTDLIKHALKIVPERYQQDISTLSSKALYYDETLREDYNHIVINDFLDSPDALGLIKVMTDNLAEKKEHKTVIDNKGVSVEIPGRNTVTITAAKDINDPETERRFLYLNPQEEEDHKKDVKKFIKQTGVTGKVDQSTVFKICQAVFDKITEKSLNVFNPWIYCINTEDKGFTDLKIFINLVKARGLIFQEHRYKIDENTILGSPEDVEAVAGLWVKIAPLQQFKLNKKQVDLLKTLPVFDQDVYRESLKDMEEDDQYTLEGTTGKTYKELIEELGVSRGTLRNWINGYEDKQKQLFKPGLKDLGFILTKSSNPNNDKAPILLYLNDNKKEYVEGLKNKLTLVNHVQYYITNGFIGLNGRNKVIELFLEYDKFLGERRDLKKSPFLENAPEDIKTDKDAYNLIVLVKKAIQGQPRVEVDHVGKILDSLTQVKNYQPPKPDKNSPKQNKTSKSIANTKNDNHVKAQNTKGEFSESFKEHETGHNTSLKSYEEILIERETLDYLNKYPDKPEFNDVARKIASKTSIDEPLVKKVIRGLIGGEAILFNERGDLILGEV